MKCINGVFGAQNSSRATPSVARYAIIYSHEMKATRINETEDVIFYSPDTSTSILLPVAENGISAGFPSPADDYLEEQIDLNKELIKNPTSTFLGRVKGCSMVDDGIEQGDLVVIDKSIPFEHGKRVLAYIDGGFTVKKLWMKDGKCQLVPSNKSFPVIDVNADDFAQIWGVVTHVIKSFT